VKLVVGKVALGQVSVRLFRLNTIIIIPPLLCIRLQINSSFIMTDGQTLEAVRHFEMSSFIGHYSAFILGYYT